MTYKLEETQFWGGKASVQAKTAPRFPKSWYEITPKVLDHTKEEDEAFAAVKYPADDGYPTAEQMKAMADELVCRGGRKLSELTEAAQNAVEQDIINTEGAKIDKDVREGLIKGPMKFDDGKRDWSLLPYDSIEEIIKVLEFGAKKYNEPGQGPHTWNWAKGSGLGKWRTLAAIFRHLTSYAKGETYDPESGLNHLAHVGCGILFLLHYHGNPKQYGKLD